VQYGGSKPEPETQYEDHAVARRIYPDRIGQSGFGEKLLCRAKHKDTQVLGPAQEAEGKDGRDRQRNHGLQNQKGSVRGSAHCGALPRVILILTRFAPRRICGEADQWARWPD
jgi:hypothetical protein